MLGVLGSGHSKETCGDALTHLIHFEDQVCANVSRFTMSGAGSHERWRDKEQHKHGTTGQPCQDLSSVTGGTTWHGPVSSL